MAFEKLTDSIRDLKINIQALKYSSTEYYKLNLYKKIVKVTLGVITGVLVGFLGIVALLFLSVAVAIAISNALDSPRAGFFIVAGFYILLIILYFVIGKKYLEKTILTKSSKKVFND